MPRISIDQGEIEYSETGSGPPIVFVHGAFVDGEMWSQVVPLLSPGFRCIVPTWPLGAHRLPMRAAADLSPGGLADAIAAVLDRLGLDDAILVGNDTGGALCQILCARRPPRVAGLVLTNSDSLDVFPPKAFSYIRWMHYIPLVPALVMKILHRVPALRRLRLVFGGASVRRLPDELLGSWLAPLADNPAVRRDLRKVVFGLSTRFTIEAAEKLAGAMPVTLAWGTRDPFLPISLGERLAAALPGTRLQRNDDAATFVPLDQPEWLASIIRDFAQSTRRPARAVRA